MSRSPEVSIIMPTMATRERADSLVRAIETVVSQKGARGVPVVVVNGRVGAPDLLAHLYRRSDIRLVVLEEANLPRALQAGRQRVQTPYFAVLDDDDELLPEALQIRVAALESGPPADVVVTNGVVARRGREELNIADFAEVEADPLRRLLAQHWLPPCAGLFRTAAVTTAFFDGIPRYREWTYLALRAALGLRIRFTARPTFVYRTDTPGSLSKSRPYCLAGPAAIRRMLELDLPADVRAILRVRLAGDLHSAAVCELEDGHYRAAWGWHLRSLVHPSGWRFVPFTRRLLLGARPGSRAEDAGST